MKTKAQHKADQRARDKIILASIGFASLEGVMSAIRKLDTDGIQKLHTVLCGRVEQEANAANKARPQTKRIREAEAGQALRRG